MPTVVKVGGSLLSRRDLPTLLERVFETVSEPILVVGGGPAADNVRSWDRAHNLGQAAAHDLAITSLQLTAALVVRICESAVTCGSRKSAEAAWATGSVPVLDVATFLSRDEDALVRGPLPATWETTSDSIAAWIARRWPAEEVVLLKSCPPAYQPETGEIDWDQTSRDGGVDPWFSKMVTGLRRVRWIDVSRGGGVVDTSPAHEGDAEVHDVRVRGAGDE